jgi:alpha-tubulin suppressor-like RCC1 family protein
VIGTFLEVLLALGHARGGARVLAGAWRLATDTLFGDYELKPAGGSIGRPNGGGGVGVGGVGGGGYDEPSSPVEVQCLDDPSLSLGTHHGAALIRGDVYTWGKAQHGRLGQGAIVEDQDSAPVCRVEMLHIHSIRVAGVACGSEHMVAYGEDGLYTWGSGKHGKLGLGDVQNRNVPTEVRGIGQVKHIACGHHFTVATLADKSVLSWGRGGEGQLGTGTFEDQHRQVALADARPPPTPVSPWLAHLPPPATPAVRVRLWPTRCEG